MNLKISLLFIPFLFAVLSLSAQAVKYNLQDMLRNNQIETVPAYGTSVLTGDKPGAITTKGIVWLKGIDFTDGVIDIDLRGKDVFLQSFLGIAFHGSDTSHCNIIYFRPFNFRNADSTRWKWSLAYMQIPDYNYARLRKEHPGVYENRIVPPPKADEWFHATIVINGSNAKVYVNHHETPSLEVTMLEGRSDGLFGLYSDGLTNDFANLTITKNIPGVVQNLNIHSYNLAALLTAGRLETDKNNQAMIIKNTTKAAVEIKGIVWIKDTSFSTGHIDIDLKGKNEMGKSFIGLAFSGKDSNDYESVYFRPFNFKSTDALRRQHMVQYMSLPDHDWQQLRTSQPLVFEHGISEAPNPDAWFHATIYVTTDSVCVYSNFSPQPCLAIKRFRTHKGEKFGLWTDGLPGDFANLSFRP
jgi:hypothetical protein